MPSVQAKTVRSFISKIAARFANNRGELDSLMAELDRVGVTPKEIVEATRFNYSPDSAFVGIGKFAGVVLNQ